MRELRWMVSLLPLAPVALDTPYSNAITCSDASGEDGGNGYAVCLAHEHDPDKIHDVAKHNERWRFREMSASELHEQMIRREKREVRRERAKLPARPAEFEPDGLEHSSSSSSLVSYSPPPGLRSPLEQLRATESGSTSDCYVTPTLSPPSKTIDFTTSLDSHLDSSIAKQDSSARRRWRDNG